jgi:hypothetical protein
MKKVRVSLVQFVSPLAVNGELLRRDDPYPAAIYEIEGFVLRRRNTIVVVPDFHADPFDEMVDFIIIPKICVRKVTPREGGCDEEDTDGK